MSRTKTIASFYSMIGMLLVGSAFSIANAQEPEIEQALRDAGATVEVYKSTTNAKGEKVDLNIYIFKPKDHKANDQRPAVVFFFGGGWRSGKPSQFTEHCKHLASRGMVAMTADYRVSSRHGTKAVKCVSDAKSAVRWIRENAKRIGVDPNRIASGGGSAGGHVAACTGVVKMYDEKSEDAGISSVPNAMILFNPALVLAPVDGQPEPDEKRLEKFKQMEARVGAKPKTISPLHNVAAGASPTIIFHGKADATVPYWTVDAFEKAMKDAGNECKLVGYEGQGHGFFNFGRKNGRYKETVAAMDKFLVGLGWLKEDGKSKDTSAK